MEDETPKWHWAEGIKCALEGIRLLFYLNGASAVAILTFIGNTKAHPQSLVFAMLFFATGSASAVITTTFAYLTQLHYGNAGQLSSQATSRIALLFHRGAYFTGGVGLLAFVAGAIFAACGLQ